MYAVSDLLELNQNMPVPERCRIARKLTFVGASPPERRQDSALDETPDAWGILLMEADNAMDAAMALQN